MVRTGTLPLALMLLAVAVTRAVASGEEEAGTPPAPTTLKILWWGTQSSHDRTLRVLDMYEARNPGVRFDPTFLDRNGYWDALYVMAAAEEMPDIYQTVIERLPLFQEKGLLADLEAIADFHLDGVDPQIVDLGRVDGRLVGACLGVNAMTLAFSRETFDRAGVAPPSPFWRWDDLREASLALRAATGVWGLNGFGVDMDFRYFVRTRGGQLFDERLTGPGWHTDSDVRDYFRLMVGYLRDGVIPPRSEWAEKRAEEESSLFAFDKAAMRIMWSNDVLAVYRKRGRLMALSRLPGPGSRGGMFLQPAMFFSISESSAAKEKAGAFVAYFVTNRQANAVLGAERGVPVAAPMRQAVTADSDEQTRAVFYYVDRVSRWSSPMSARFPAREAEYTEIFSAMARRVSLGEVSPEEAPALLRARIVRLLARGEGE